jgi:hypothetical protein
MDVFILGACNASHYTTQEENYVCHPLARTYIRTTPFPAVCKIFPSPQNQIVPVTIKPQYTAVYLAAGCTDLFIVTR